MSPKTYYLCRTARTPVPYLTQKEARAGLRHDYQELLADGWVRSWGNAQDGYVLNRGEERIAIAIRLNSRRLYPS